MSNSSLGSHFTLGAYSEQGPWRWLYFLILLCVYALVVASNLLLILVIVLERSLHHPMFLFLCSLFVNELMGSTVVFPFLLFQMLQDVHLVSRSMCFLQIFFTHSYGAVEFFNLAVMSFDRYLAICRPLHYRQLMAPRQVAVIIGALWAWSTLGVLISICLTSQLTFCRDVIPKVYCDNYSVVKLACSDTTVSNVYGLAYIFTVLPTVLALIVYSYGRILRVCLSGCGRARQKAVHTCVPHLVSLFSFSFGSIFEMVQSRFDMSHVPLTLRILLSLYFLTVQPLLNPLVYGLSLSKVRGICQGLLCKSAQL